jgi:hypothetical protein
VISIGIDRKPNQYSVIPATRPRGIVLRNFVVLAATLCFTLHLGSAKAALWEVKPFPTDQIGATLKVDNGTLSSWSLASGHYIAKNGQIVVFNYFGGPQNPAAKGMFGVLLDAAVQDTKAKHYAPLVDNVTVDLRPATQAAVSEQVAPLLVGHMTSTDSTLTISPFAYFAQEKPGIFRIRVLLRARLDSKSGKKLWQNDYFSPSTEARPLEGNENWFTEDRYAQTTAAAIQRVAPVLARDLLGQLARQRVILLGAGRTWNAYFESPVAVLEETDEWLVVRDDPGGGKALAADVSLVEKSGAQIKPFGK